MSYFSGGFLGEIAVRRVVQVALLAGVMVDDVHLPVVVDPEAPHDDVMDSGGDFPPGEVTSCLCKLQVSYTCQQHDHLH